LVVGTGLYRLGQIAIDVTVLDQRSSAHNDRRTNAGGNQEETMRTTSRTATLAAVCTALWAMSAVAQDYPTRQINMVIPFPPGGNTDLMARALQPELAKALGQSVVAINKGGAGGTIGNIEVSSSRADGYTIGLTPNNPLTALWHG
jgi:hypothetical protein